MVEMKLITYIHPRARNLSHVNAIADLIGTQVAITKQLRRFAALFLRLRRSETYILAGNLDLVGTTAMYLLAPFPGRYVLLVSSHRTNAFHSHIVNVFTKMKGARIAFVTEEARVRLAEKLGAHILGASGVVHHSSQTADLALNRLETPAWSERYYDILFFGRLNVERGLPEFLEIVESLPQLRFAVAGSGPLAVHVAEAARRLDNLDFLDFIGNSDAKLTLLSNARLVFSNMKGTENFGISILEAVAAGAAVSCPRDYGPEAILGAGSPYLRPPEASTAQKIAHLLECLAAGPVPHDVTCFHSSELRKRWLRLIGRSEEDVLGPEN